MNQNTTAQYKPKTGVISRGEVIDNNEMFFLTVLTDEFEPRVMPGQALLMRRGCLAEDGDIVAPGNGDADSKRVELYVDGVDYYAVCVGIYTHEGLPYTHKQAEAKKA